MAISRAQLVKELEPGLNALFGMEYDRYDQEHTEIYDTESSDRAFEEEVMLSGFGNAATKSEGAGVSFDSANEVYTSRYTMETIALAFALTEEAMEDNLYDQLGARYTRALARSMAHTKQVKAAATLNNAFNSSFTGGDGKELCATDHPLGGGGTFRNEPTTAADLNETSLENALIDISNFVDERNMIVALRGMKLIIPPAPVVVIVLLPILIFPKLLVIDPESKAPVVTMLELPATADAPISDKTSLADLPSMLVPFTLRKSSSATPLVNTGKLPFEIPVDRVATVVIAVPFKVMASASRVPSISASPLISKVAASSSPDMVIFLPPVISLLASVIIALLAITVPLVIPSIKFISTALAVTPSSMFNSAAVDVIVVLAMDIPSVSRTPSTSTLPDISKEAAAT